jgi:5-methylcytosine-specific restriction endonuclease McrA
MVNPFKHQGRRRFTVLERAAFFAAADGHCQKCTRKIPHSDDWDLDHIIPLSRGGTNDDHNMQVLCSWCHDDKTHGTDGDVAGAAKDKRVYAKRVVPKRFSRSRSWGWR